MDWLTGIVLLFSILGGIDYVIGNKFGIGEEFEKGVSMLGPLTITMTGMLILAPAISHVLQGIVGILPNFIEPSIISSSLLANDMGGAALSKELCRSAELGAFNGMVVASMMGCTVSFTIPAALGVVNKKYHKDMIVGILCGIVTIPIGCFVGGIITGIHIVELFRNIIPLVIFSGLIVFALLKAPEFCVKVFSVFGIIIKGIVILGLLTGIIEFLSGIKIISNADTLDNTAKIILNAACVMTGIFPLLSILSKLIKKPLDILSKKSGINETSAMGFISTIATSFTTFKMISEMDKKGIILNSAFLVSGAFILTDHLAFTMAYNSDYVLSVTVGKLVAGMLAVALANAIYIKR